MSKEIERKYLISKYPKHLDAVMKHNIEQIYFKLKDISTSEEIRIRKISNEMGINYFMTIKSAGNMIREENEYSIAETTYNELKEKETKSNLIPTITKDQTIFSLPDCHHKIEYNVVDKNIKGGWKYIEVEFDSIEEAEAFDINKYISNTVEVTNYPEYKMRNYWLATRLGILTPVSNTATDISTAIVPCINAVINHINKSKQLMYDIKNKVGEYPNSGFNDDKSMLVIPGGFRNIRLAVMANENKVNHPHFHFFKPLAPIDEVTGRGGGALLIKDAMHFKHDSHQDRINYVEIQALNKFLESNYPGLDISIWQFILEKWNEMNPIHIQEVDINSSIPKYIHNMPVVFGR